MSFPVSLIVLDMQADKDSSRAFEQTSDGAGAAGDTERVKLLAGGRFDHAVEFLEIETLLNLRQPTSWQLQRPL